MAWPSAWGNRRQRKKPACCPRTAANWKFATKHFSVKYVQFHWHFCHWKKSECFMSSLSELFCFDLTILLHLVWPPVFYKNLNQNESKCCCWNKIVREWPNSQLLLVISREIPTFGAFSSIFSMFFKMSEFPSGLWILVYPLPQIPQTVHQVSLSERNWIQEFVLLNSHLRNAKAKSLEISDDFVSADFQDFWPQRLLESARLNVSNVIWATRESKGTCRKISSSYKHVCKCWAS